MNLADIATIMSAATPLLLAALGELVVEKSGVLNLGVEGMMLIGAIVGFILAINGYPAFWCFVLAALSSVLLALLFGWFVLYIRSNQVATGLALAILGSGLSSLFGASYVGQQYAGIGKLSIPYLSDTPYIGIFFQQDILIYFSLIMVFLVFWFLNKTKLGLILRGVGENHNAAYALGHKVIFIKLSAIAFGGAMAGLGGAYMSLVSPHLWTLQLTAGRGWIAIALVVFATWRPMRLLFGAYLFGAISVMQYSLQNTGIKIPAQIWAMMPYLITIIVLVFISMRVNWKHGKNGKSHAPADLGKPFIRHA